MRYGEMTAFEERPHSPYYGAVDATPLYVVLLDEYERWTGDRALVRELEVEARAALNWIDEYADLQGTGYVWYQRRNEESGLENQCWKDSWDSISFRDGKLPGFPRATCELQGYAYDAKVRGARLAREIWKDAALADKLDGRRGRPEAALQPRLLGRGRRVLRARARPGRAQGRRARRRTTATCSGAASSTSRRRRPSRATCSAPRLFSGWGVRTLAEGEGRYNPIGYHIGTVWPFDNSFIAWGLRRYGFKDEAARDRRRHPRRCGVLRRPAAGGVRRLPARADEVSGAVPDRVQPAGVVDRDAAPAPPHDARARAATASTSSSTRRCRARSATSSCSTSPAAGAGSTRSVAAACAHRLGTHSPCRRLSRTSPSRAGLRERPCDDGWCARMVR